MADPQPATLLDVLRQRLPQASSTTLRKMLANDRVRVNGAVERVAKRPIGPGDRVEVLARPERPLDPRLRILFEDRDLVVVDKAAGLLSVPSPVELHDTAEGLLQAWVAARGEARGVVHVHRLDRDTSGVLVFAKGEWMRGRLQDLFAAHDVERVYVAVVHGTPLPRAGTLRSFLAEGEDLRVRRVGDPAQGREAITHYRTTASGRGYALLEVTLETGRRHQIRVQLADAGHPVVGDPMYGGERGSPLGRLALHAERLGFVHPRTRRRMTFSSPTPAAFRGLLA